MTMAFSIVIDEIKFRVANSRRLRTVFPNFERGVHPSAGKRYE